MFAFSYYTLPLSPSLKLNVFLTPAIKCRTLGLYHVEHGFALFLVALYCSKYSTVCTMEDNSNQMLNFSQTFNVVYIYSACFPCSGNFNSQLIHIRLQFFSPQTLSFVWDWMRCINQCGCKTKNTITTHTTQLYLSLHIFSLCHLRVVKN